jgi:DNA-binding transcriptional LysR family regulator
VPLVSYGEPCVHHRVAVKALKTAGMEWEVVFTGSSMNSLNGAVSAGLGVLAISRRRAAETGFTVWEDAPLPRLPDLYRGIYVREGGSRAAYEQLADDIAAALSDETVSVPKKHMPLDMASEQNSAA